jgi:ATP-dependent exoDNAse (exonuclease V) alpha subunit
MTVQGKAQGSQFEEVIFVLPDRDFRLDAELIYTGVTRASKGVEVCIRRKFCARAWSEKRFGAVPGYARHSNRPT